ncbi:hypothetical protein MUP77_16375 [Candidatus Bathyarchaeota archaeon]|nr:hypothetical protein [Candidatus Bathyarchaeota archaeon]
MSHPNNKAIEKIAESVRKRLEAEEISPEDRCIDYARELVKSLKDKGIDSRLVVGRYRHPCLLGRRDVYGDYSKGHLWAHAWAETKKTIVDITGDQFNHYIADQECDEDDLEPVQVIRKSSSLSKRYKKR